MIGNAGLFTTDIKAVFVIGLLVPIMLLAVNVTANVPMLSYLIVGFANEEVLGVPPSKFQDHALGESLD